MTLSLLEKTSFDHLVFAVSPSIIVISWYFLNLHHLQTNSMFLCWHFFSWTWNIPFCWIPKLFSLYSFIIGWQATKEWDHFYERNWPFETPCKDFNLAVEGGLGWTEWLKNGRKRFYISCNYSCTISFLVDILLVKLKYLYIQYTWISIMKK